jgi:hypothetical protein
MKLSVSIVVGITLLVGVGINTYTTVHVAQNFDIGKHVFCFLFVETFMSTLILMTLTVTHVMYVNGVWYMIPCHLWFTVGALG